MKPSDFNLITFVAELNAELLEFAVEELDALFDTTKNEHGYPKGRFADTFGIAIAEDFGNKVILAISPERSLEASPGLGKSVVVMSAQTAIALGELLKVAAEKALRN